MISGCDCLSPRCASCIIFCTCTLRSVTISKHAASSSAAPSLTITRGSLSGNTMSPNTAPMCDEK